MMSEHVGKVCRIGQGHECCRYLMMGPKGFECAKVAGIRVKALLDQRVAEEAVYLDTIVALNKACAAQIEEGE